MILILDNYDSFVHNVARSLREMGAEVRVVRSDALAVGDALAMQATAIVLSPGPRTPSDAGISVAVARAAPVPVLGICLGHQAVAAAFGGRIVPSPNPMHGRATAVRHGGGPLFAGVSDPLQAGRYHSLSVDAASLPDVLEILAWTDDGEIMALGHRARPVYGVQFHPESVLTPEGHAILRNFLVLTTRPAPVGLS